jgi:hypothetical protein
MKRHRVVRISPQGSFNYCSRCHRPAKGIRRDDGRVVLVHSDKPVPVAPSRRVAVA